MVGSKLLSGVDLGGVGMQGRANPLFGANFRFLNIKVAPLLKIPGFAPVTLV